MESPSPRVHIEERAAEFLRRRDAGPWSEVEQAELAAWLAAATAHRVAFLRTEAAWEEMGRLKAIAAGLPHGKVPTPGELSATHFLAAGAGRALTRPENVRRVRQTLNATLALVGSVLLASVLAIGSYELWLRGDRYATPVGGVASIPLQDGSHITLNTGSEVRVVLNDKERNIELAQGEAFFEVAHDKSRPFIVQAGSKRVTAVGTQFSVRIEGDDIQVVVTEGAVRLESAGRLATAGTIARVGTSGVSIEKERIAEAEDILSWRSGYVVFHETRLADAAAEFNRYNTRQIVIQDPAVANMKLTGKFRATNNETFVDLLEQTFHLHVQRTASAIVLSDAAPP